MIKNKPYKEFVITALFGKDILNGEERWHNGIDISMPTGTPIFAVDNGIVKVAKDNPGGYGLYVAIDHTNYGSLYAHLSKYIVKVGQVVKAGELIGYSGNTGLSTGAHLDFEIRQCTYDKFWERDTKTGKYIHCIDTKPYLTGETIMKKVEYFETPFKTRILCGDLDMLKIGVQPNGIANTQLNSKLGIKNAINGTFFYSGKDSNGKTIYYSTSILYIDYNGVKGVQGSWQANHFPYPQSCLFKYKDNTMKMKRVYKIADIESELPKCEFVLGGIGLLDNGKLLRYEDEGFIGAFSDVARKANKTLIAVNSKTKKVYLVTRENIANRASNYDLEDLAKDLNIDYGCDYILQLDGGGSTVQYKDGKIIAGGGGRLIHNYLYFI